MAVELDTTGNGAIDIEKGGTNAKTAGEALSNLGGQPYDADLDILSSGTFSQKRALIEAFARPVLGVDALRTTMADFDGDCRYLAYHTAYGDGGQGTFVWSTADLSAEVTADTQHGIYVAPTSDPTGVNGAWVRQYSGYVTPEMFGGDIQAALSALTSGGVVKAPNTYSVDTLSISNDNTTLDFLGTGGLVYSGTSSARDLVVLSVSGDNVLLRNGEITSPETWDGTNAGWVGAVVYVTGSHFTADNITLNNVPKVGFGFRNTTSPVVKNCTIHGNFAEAAYTGANTAQFGINYDPPASPLSGQPSFVDNEIDTCVQGIFLGNYGSVNLFEDNVIISGNRITECWNHGVYSAGVIHGCVVDGNSFNRCQLPVALTGMYNVVSNNSMKTYTTGNDVDRTGISMRDPSGCVITGNTIIGDGATNGTVIDLRGVFESVLQDNIVSNNVLNINGGTSTAISIGANGGTACRAVNNLISNNTISCVGRGTTFGLINVMSSSTVRGEYNRIAGNNITVRGTAHGISMLACDYSSVENNTIIFRTNLGSSTYLAAIYPSASSYNVIRNNITFIPDGYGANINLRNIWETSTSLSNITSNNDVINNGMATSITPLVILTTSGTLTNERGAGAPAHASGVGSTWLRTDGGTNTTLYVKESGISSSGWVAK